MCTSCQNTNARNGNGCGCSCGCGWSGWQNTCGCRRYISFPVSGTAYVPVSAMYFYPNSLGTNGNTNGNGVTSGNSNGNSNGNNGCGCCGFGRCGGTRAFFNYNEDYYARQYGLND